MMSNYIRNNFEIETGSKILADAGKYRYGFYPFSSAMKKHTGLTTTKMYKKSVADLQQVWIEENNKLNLTKSELIPTKNTKTVTNYTFPHYLNDGSLIALKHSFKETPYLVIFKDGKEHKLATIGIATQEFLSVVNNKIAWTEHQKDLRHANKNYSNIITFDINTKSYKKLTQKERYFSPSHSNSGEKIASIRYKENIEYVIDIIDAKNGATIDSIPNPNNDFLSTPKWTKNDTAIIYLAKRNSKLAFFRYNFNTKTRQQLSEWTANTIGQFSLGNNAILTIAPPVIIADKPWLIS